MKRNREKELQALIARIEGDYDDNYVMLARDLQKIAYCLHFVSNQDIPRSELQVLSFFAYELGECLYTAEKVRKKRLSQ